jgi:predicted MFS family arabinose efflux permease
MSFSLIDFFCVQASLETFFGLGLIVGPTVGGGLYQLGGYTLPFAVTGGMIFSVALLILIFMPKNVQSSDVENSQNKSGSMAGYGILTILKIPGVLLATLAIITGAISIGFLSSSLEPHIRQFKLTPLTTGLVFVINGGVYALTAPAWGWLCDRIKQTKYITLIGSICLTVGFALIGPAPFFPYET